MRISGTTQPVLVALGDQVAHSLSTHKVMVIALVIFAAIAVVGYWLYYRFTASSVQVQTTLKTPEQKPMRDQQVDIPKDTPEVDTSEDTSKVDTSEHTSVKLPDTETPPIQVRKVRPKDLRDFFIQEATGIKDIQSAKFFVKIESSHKMVQKEYVFKKEDSSSFDSDFLNQKIDFMLSDIASIRQVSQTSWYAFFKDKKGYFYYAMLGKISKEKPCGDDRQSEKTENIITFWQSCQQEIGSNTVLVNKKKKFILSKP